MKKVLSVALASAMVLGMGANAFAISYSTGSNNEADWPTDFQFDGELFVTDKDGDIIEESTTELNDNEAVDFEPGDVIWMPLYADDQLVYDADWTEGTSEVDAVSNVKLEKNVFETETVDSDNSYWHSGNKWYTAGGMKELTKDEIKKLNDAGFYPPADAPESSDTQENYPWVKTVVTGVDVNEVPGYESDIDEIKFDGIDRVVVEDSAKFYINGKSYSLSKFEDEVSENEVLLEDVYATVNLKVIDATDDVVGKPVVDHENGYREYGHYTGNIDKNWSINLIEKSTGVAELIEKAELYKATATDYASYSEFTDEIMPNAVYLKITLEDTWKTVDSETLTYYVYVADNDSGKQTNEVWVSGKYVNNNWEYVNFDWTNDASKAQLWKVKKGENGTAVFDFADKAFFTVKMYSGESMYLDLSTAYDKAIAGEMDAEADSFYKFDNDNANFSRTGELIIVTDDSSLVPYEIDEDGNFVEVDAKYVEDYAIAHTNKKVDGFVFSTKTLGNYVLSTEELGQEEQPAKETPAEPVTPSEPTQETPAPETSKPNPETGAEDFVGLAVSLAVVSVAAAGALALKK